MLFVKYVMNKTLGLSENEEDLASFEHLLIPGSLYLVTFLNSDIPIE